MRLETFNFYKKIILRFQGSFQVRRLKTKCNWMKSSSNIHTEKITNSVLPDAFFLAWFCYKKTKRGRTESVWHVTHTHRNINAYAYAYTFHITNYIVQRLLLEASRSSASREIPRIFMELEGSLPHSQEPATCPYSETHRSSPFTPIPLL